MKNAKIHIGTSGFHYKDWKGAFYPEKINSKEWITYYAKHFSTVELNSTFYRTPSKESIKNWLNNTPKNFLFTIKVSRMITHFLRLKYTEEAMKNFLKIVKPFKRAKKLACLLYQLPPNFKKNREVLEKFLKKIPKEQKNVFEFRHESWNDDETFQLLKEYNASYCIVSSDKYSTHLISTTENVYIRFHGPKDIYSSKYSDEELQEWAKKIKKFLQQKKEVFAYFNNDIHAHAVKNAKKLIELMQKK
jgi:uncharacterized protein YecE (DUF72 family)